MFTLTINTDNDAFFDPNGENDKLARDIEVARILRALAKGLEDGVSDQMQGGVLDINGNVCGKWFMVETCDPEEERWEPERPWREDFHSDG